MTLAALQSNERNALQVFVKKLDRSYPDLRQVILYGSKARGDGTDDSDIDVMVVLPQENSVIRRDILTIAARVSLDYDVLLNPLIIGEARFNQQRDFSLYRNIARDALVIPVDF